MFHIWWVSQVPSIYWAGCLSSEPPSPSSFVLFLSFYRPPKTEWNMWRILYSLYKMLSQCLSCPHLTQVHFKRSGYFRINIIPIKNFGMDSKTHDEPWIIVGKCFFWNCSNYTSSSKFWYYQIRWTFLMVVIRTNRKRFFSRGILTRLAGRKGVRLRICKHRTAFDSNQPIR